jgi:phosphate starvation-inducible protein PhoH and related proteins
MSNKNKYGGKYGGSKRRRKQHTAKTGETEFNSQPRKPREKLSPKTDSQREYIEVISTHDIIFADGPAGCGKTFVATAMGLQDVLAGKYERLVITRPVLEAGEKLGFLPGKASEKSLSMTPSDTSSV